MKHRQSSCIDFCLIIAILLFSVSNWCIHRKNFNRKRPLKSIKSFLSHIYGGTCTRETIKTDRAHGDTPKNHHVKEQDQVWVKHHRNGDEKWVKVEVVRKLGPNAIKYRRKYHIFQKKMEQRTIQ